MALKEQLKTLGQNLSFKPDELLHRLKTDERFFIESCLSVRDKSNQLVPYLFNAVQDWYEGVKSSFDIILKSRKLGISTRIIAKSIHACAFRQGQHAILISHDEPHTKLMLEERVKPLVRSSKFPLGAVERDEYIYFPATGSRLYIGTAGSRKFGRGSDITLYHLSEYAYYEDPSLITGIEEGCLDGAQGYIETTANGENFFRQDWKRAERGEGRYKAIFIPWWRDPSYSLPGVEVKNLGEDEQKLIDAYGLSLEQLAWRRKKIASMTRPELFDQEYPSSPEVAFLSSGRMVFDWMALIQHEQKCEDPKWVGFLRDMGESIELQPHPSGSLKVWVPPQPNHVYVIGADVAEGIKDGAYSAAFVLDVGTSAQVAGWHGHIAPDAFGEVLFLLGLFYNTALIAPESWPGVGGITEYKLMELRYKNLYKRRASAGSHRTEEQLMGWETNFRTKPSMILSLAGEAIREYNMTVKDKALVDEMRSFVYNAKGEMIPQLGCFSDRLIAAGIAWSVSREIAAGVHYDTPKLRQMEAIANRANGFITAPSWKGSMYGTR